MGGAKPLQCVININNSVDTNSSSCTNGTIPQLPHKVLSLYVKLQALRKM